MGEMFSVILAVMAVALRENSGPPASTPGLVLFHLLVYLATVALIAIVKAQVERKSSRPVLGLALVLLFPAFAWFSEWVPFAVQLTGGIPFVRVCVALIPFFLGQGIKTEALYRARRAAGQMQTRRTDFHLLRFRMLLLPLIPMLILQGIRSLTALFPELHLTIESWPPAQILMLGTTMVLVISITPLILRIVTGSHPLPEGPLRDRLEAYNQRVGFRPSRILVWKTGGSMPNAMFIGILPWHRYVILTDALMSQLDDAAVEGVYAHEIGHGARAHLPFFLLFLFSTITIAITQTSAATPSLFAMDELTASLVFTGVVLPLGLVAFGWISRRFESEADFHATSTIPDPSDFDRGLREVGLAAGILSHRGGFRHFDIGTRLGLLNRFRSEPEFRERFRSTLRRTRYAIVGLALLAASSVILNLPNFEEARSLQRAVLLAERGRSEEKPELLREAEEGMRPFLAHPRLGEDARTQLHYTLSSLGDLALARGDWTEARRVATAIEPLGATNDIEKINRDLLDAFLRATGKSGRSGAAAAVSATEIRRLIEDLDRLTTAYRLDPRSVQQAYCELYLALRSTGDQAPVTAGDPKRWPLRIARKLWVEESGEELPPIEEEEQDPIHALLLYEKAKDTAPAR